MQSDALIQSLERGPGRALAALPVPFFRGIGRVSRARAAEILADSPALWRDVPGGALFCTWSVERSDADVKSNESASFE